MDENEKSEKKKKKNKTAFTVLSSNHSSSARCLFLPVLIPQSLRPNQADELQSTHNFGCGQMNTKHLK